jgi:hypothetical protein
MMDSGVPLRADVRSGALASDSRLRPEAERSIGRRDPAATRGHPMKPQRREERRGLRNSLCRARAQLVRKVPGTSSFVEICALQCVQMFAHREGFGVRRLVFALGAMPTCRYSRAAFSGSRGPHDSTPSTATSRLPKAPTRRRSPKGFGCGLASLRVSRLCGLIALHSRTGRSR